MVHLVHPVTGASKVSLDGQGHEAFRVQPVKQEQLDLLVQEAHKDYKVTIYFKWIYFIWATRLIKWTVQIQAKRGILFSGFNGAQGPRGFDGSPGNPGGMGFTGNKAIFDMHKI